MSVATIEARVLTARYGRERRRVRTKSDIAKLRRQAERMGYKFSHRGKH